MIFNRQIGVYYCHYDHWCIQSQYLTLWSEWTVHNYHFCQHVLFSESSLAARTFNIEGTTIFVFSLCVGLVIQLNDSDLKVLKHNHITKRVRERLISNSRFLNQNLLNQLFCYADVKQNYLFVAYVAKTLDLNNLGRSNGLTTVFPHLVKF